MPRQWNRFRLGEISVVTQGAQPGADIVSEKSAEDNMEPNEIEKNDLVDVVTSTDLGHAHGIRVRYDGDGLDFYVHFSEAIIDGVAHSHDHQIIRGDNGDFIAIETLGHTHTIPFNTIEQLLTNAVKSGDIELPADVKVADLLADFPNSDKSSNNGESTMTDAEIKALKEKEAKLEADNATLTKVNALPEDQRKHYEGLEDDAKVKFLDLSVSDRANAVANAKSADDVIFTDIHGKEYKKGDVTETELVLLKKVDDLEREKADLETQNAEKSAAAVLETIKDYEGTDEEKQAIAKSVASLPADQRDGVIKMLTSNKGDATSKFRKLSANAKDEIMSTKSNDDDGAYDEFEKLVAEKMAADKCSRSKAVTKVLAENKDLATKVLS